MRIASCCMPFFTTLTNVNFNAAKFVELIQQAGQTRDRAKALYEASARAAHEGASRAGRRGGDQEGFRDPRRGPRWPSVVRPLRA